MALPSAIHALRDSCDTQKRAQYARQFWDVATKAGEAGATTTFHAQHDKNDWYWDAQHNVQLGDRGNALGYLTQMRFTRWLGSESGRQVTGVDCSRAGRSAERERRVRQIVMQFFGLAVRLSKRCEIRRGDVEAVARCRSLNVGSFCLFPGFTEALLSYELRDLTHAWRQEEAAEVAPDVPTPGAGLPGAPTPGAGLPGVPTPGAALPGVPTPDAGLPGVPTLPTLLPESCEPPPKSPTQPPAAPLLPKLPTSPPEPCGPAAAQSPTHPPAAGSGEELPHPSGEDLQRLAASALAAALNDFGEAQFLAPSLSFGATGCRTYAQTSLYEVRVKRVRNTRSGRPPYESCILLRGVLKRGARNTVLRTTEEIRDAFSRKNPR